MTTTELDHFRDKRECQCGNTKAKNNSLVWRINECGCVICNICEDLNFSRGSNKCQTCQIVIYKHKFRNLVFDDPLVDKEIHIRKQLLCIFNKSEKDFKSLNDYYDYEEMFEDIVHSLRGCLQVGIFLIFSPEQGYLDFFWVENTSPKIPEVKNTK